MALSDTLSVPLLEELAPNGFFYGGHYIVEFDPDSLWYETSLTITALALKRGTKTEYHVFQHFPSEAKEKLSKLGVDAEKLEKEGLLSIWDSYTPTIEYEKEKAKMEREKGNQWQSTKGKPLDLVKSAKSWAESAKAGYPEDEKRWLHIDDNTAIFLQYNDEKTMIDSWRIGPLPFGIRARETPHFLAFVKGVASEAFYTKFEALCDGIIDLKSQEEGGQINNYIRVRMLRGKTFDSRWHRIELGADENVKFAGDLSGQEQRRLSSIMFTDIVGYTSLSQKNESLALELLEKHRTVLRSVLPKYHGREVKTMGDGFLVEFESALEAVRCAVEIQKTLHETDYGSLPESGINLRIGIHLGDVIHKGNDVYGDAVNITSRIEPLAPPGGICISGQVYDHIRNKFDFPLVSTGKQEMKNVDLPIEVYNVSLPWKGTRLPSTTAA